VLSRVEVQRILKATDNIRHQAILYLAYSPGLRVSEVFHLQLWDIDHERKTLFIR